MAYQPPKEPDHTCPIINEVLAWMDEFECGIETFEDLSVSKLRATVEHYQHHVADMQNKMEEIRAANDALRQRSGYFEEEYEKASSDLYDRNNDVSELQDEIKELQSEYERFSRLDEV